MRIRLLQGFLGIVLISFFCLSQAEALLVPASISDLAKGSQAIITGTVVNKESQWSIEHTTIYTYVTILVNEKIKNSTKKDLDVGKTINLRIEGGVVGDIGMGVSDMPVFDLNEAVFLFLDADSGVFPRLPEGERAGDFIVYGWEMGKFTVIGKMIQIEDRKENVKGKIDLQDFITDINSILSEGDVIPSYLRNLK